tara:strand:+ start:5737 stop:7359 length:1623 start_codon:yes stop_codon:yes gene_type:complete
MRLPYRPQPYPAESLAGYSVRLTSWYGYQSPDAFARHNFGYPLPAAMPDQSVTMDRWIQSLEEVTQVPPNTLGVHFMTHRRKHEHVEGRHSVSDIIVSPPRICEHCISETGYHRFEWQVAHKIVCTKHIAPILDQCPSCRSSLRWNKNLLTGCSACGYKWGKRTIPDSSDLWAIKRAEENISNVDALYQGFLHSAFHSGHSIWPKSRLPYEPALHFELMKSAYRLVCDRSYNEAFAIQAPNSTVGTLEDVVARKRREKIRSIYCPISSSGVRFELVEAVPFLNRPEMVLPKKHQKHLCDVAPTDIADGAFISEVLGITVSELNQLVSTGAIDCLASSQILRDRIFSLKQVTACLDDLFSKKSGKSEGINFDLSLREAASIAEKYGFGFVDCVDWCISGEMPFNLTGTGKALSWIQVPHEQLVTLCRSKFDQEDGARLLDRPTAMKLLGVPENVLDHLGRVGLLPSEKWYGPGVMFSFETVRRFLNEYDIARREAIIRGVPMLVLWSQWLESNRRVVIEALPGGHTIGIIESGAASNMEAA